VFELFHTLMEQCRVTSLELCLEGLPRVLVLYAQIDLLLMFNPARVLVSFLYFFLNTIAIRRRSKRVHLTPAPAYWRV
jgi:hypothetical protein